MTKRFISKHLLAGRRIPRHTVENHAPITIYGRHTRCRMLAVVVPIGSQDCRAALQSSRKCSRLIGGQASGTGQLMTTSLMLGRSLCPGAPVFSAVLYLSTLLFSVYTTWGEFTDIISRMNEAKSRLGYEVVAASKNLSVQWRETDSLLHHALHPKADKETALAADVELTRPNGGDRKLKKPPGRDREYEGAWSAYIPSWRPRVVVLGRCEQATVGVNFSASSIGNIVHPSWIDLLHCFCQTLFPLFTRL
jgi:hypothetical protein